MSLVWRNFSFHFQEVRSVTLQFDGFSGLVVSILAIGTRVLGFKPGRSRWIFTDVKILSMPRICPMYQLCGM
jgi:hypothetical protein